MRWRRYKAGYRKKITSTASSPVEQLYLTGTGTSFAMTSINLTSAFPPCSPADINDLHPTCFHPITQYPFYYSSSPQLLSNMSDQMLTLITPIVAYWLYSFFFHKLDTAGWKWPEKYRIHTSEEEKARNIATPSQVFWGVILQQVLQTCLGLWWLSVDEMGHNVDHQLKMQYFADVARPTMRSAFGTVLGETLLPEFAYFAYWWGVPVFQFALAMFCMDTYFYFGHRLFHSVEFLYKRVHSHHHRLYVPYAYGALYNHPVEGLLLDSLGAAIAEAVTGLSTRQAMLFFLIATLKSVDDHAGYKFPFDPFQIFTENSADYHDIHHQTIGIKSNFSQPFFVHWDSLLGTKLTRQDIEIRKGKKAEKEL
ncbi:sphingosine hydroxylase, partial [Flammula alnicola]